jgi:fatty acid synthase subunit alpha, fungi type
MESQGAGVHIVMSAKTALELGAPVVSSLSLQLPHKFLCKVTRPAVPSRLQVVELVTPSRRRFPLNILYLSLTSHITLANSTSDRTRWLTHEQSQLREEIKFCEWQGEPVNDEYFNSRVADIEKEAGHQEKDALATYGMLEGADACISPLRRVLAVWGSTGDVGVLSIHSTSTGAKVSYMLFLAEKFAKNFQQEKNETQIWNDIFTSLACTPGNAVLVMAQKSLLGHSKGRSAAWQMMGLLQAVGTRATEILSELFFFCVTTMPFDTSCQQHRCHVPEASLSHVPFQIYPH